MMYCNIMRNRFILIITMHKGTYEFTYVKSELIDLNQKYVHPFFHQNN